MLYLSQHVCFGVRVAFSTNENPVQTRIGLCYKYTQSVDEDKDSKQILDLYSPTRCVDSLELTNAATP